MRRAARPRVARAARAAACLCVVAACRSRPDAPPPGVDSLATAAVTDTLVLTAGRPAAERRLDLASARGATALEVTLLRIDNPSLTPFSVRVRIVNAAMAGTAADTVVLGEFAVYPPDRTGRYVVGLPAEEAARLRARGEGAAVLRLDLVPLAPVPARQTIRVVAGPVVWR